MPKFTLKFDEFFKRASKEFFEALNFRVETELEIFKLPKKLDVLIIENYRSKAWSREFSYLTYFERFNLISFKSITDNLTNKDISDTVVYLNGFIGMEKKANLRNCTMTLIASSKPEKFLKNNAAFAKKLQNGHYIINYNLFSIHILCLHELDFAGIDTVFLLNFAPSDKLHYFKEIIKNPDAIGEKVKEKMLAIFNELFYTRVRAFESDSLREALMSITQEADITEWVLPYYNKGMEKGIKKREKELVLNMHKNGFDIPAIGLATNLSEEKIRSIIN